tara:strand:- start:48130 stop:48330 length:201 start_codon:yes stop_codon:yes gene_type:complete
MFKGKTGVIRTVLFLIAMGSMFVAIGNGFGSGDLDGFVRDNQVLLAIAGASIIGWLLLLAKAIKGG